MRIGFLNRKRLYLPKFETADNVKLISSLWAKGKNKEDFVQISTHLSDKSLAPIHTEISHVSSDFLCASHTFKIDNIRKIFDGFSMNSFIRSHGYGELMRLASLIHMKENGLVKNQIEALSSAIPFHYKYGFRPDFANCDLYNNMSVKFDDGSGESPFHTAKNALLYLSQNYGLLHSSKVQCRNLLDNLVKNRNLDNKELKILDSLMSDYLEKNIDNWDEKLMVDDIPMSLSMDRIEENASFYNKLFEKHSIDYGV